MAWPEESDWGLLPKTRYLPLALGKFEAIAEKEINEDNLTLDTMRL